MAAPIFCHEFEISEPTYFRVKTNNPKLENFNKPLKALWTAISSKIIHTKIISEFKILHVLLYKRSGQLRKTKCFQLLKRVEACLKRFEKFDKIYSLMATLHEDLTSANSDLAARKPFVYLPPQQTWSYLLYLKTLFVRLLEATISYCVCAFRHLSNQFALGWIVPSMVLYMTVTSRIWLLSGRLSEKLVEFYNELYAYKACFERTDSKWNEPTLPSILCCTFTINASKDMERFSKDKNETTKPEIGEKKQNEYDLFQEEDFGVPVTIQRKKEETERIRENNYEGISKVQGSKKKERKQKKNTLSSNSQEQNNNHETLVPVKKAKKRKACITPEVGESMKKTKKETHILSNADEMADGIDKRKSKKKKKADTAEGLEFAKNIIPEQSDQQSLVKSSKSKKLKKKRKKKHKLTKNL